MEETLYKAAISAGVGGIIALVIIYLAYRLLSELMTKVGADMVSAFQSQATAMTRQAESMEGLTKSLQEYVTRDTSEHREIIILLKVANERLTHMEDKLNGGN